MKETSIKMRKNREEKGITLIALIITVVVLLILAAVAISSITNDGILGHAENAAKKYNQAVKNEQDALDLYEGLLSNKLNGDKDGDYTVDTTMEVPLLNFISDWDKFGCTYGAVTYGLFVSVENASSFGGNVQIQLSVDGVSRMCDVSSEEIVEGWNEDGDVVKISVKAIDGEKCSNSREYSIVLDWQEDNTNGADKIFFIDENTGEQVSKAYSFHNNYSWNS